MFFVVDVNSSGFDQLVGFLDMESVTGNYRYDFETSRTGQMDVKS